MTAGLIPCPDCRRHIRATETACPFCARSLRSELAGSVRPNVTARLSRAALIALGTTLASCGSTVESVDGAALQDSALADVPADRGNFAPPYGIVPFDSGTDAGVTDAGTPADQGNVVQPYGAPPPRDSGADVQPADVGNFAPPYGTPVMQDSGTDGGHGGVMPLYGSPPSPEHPW